MLIFVYGTLKRGYGNHARYLDGAAFIGNAQTVQRYAMLGHGVPMLVPTKHAEFAAPIAGELYDLDPGHGALEKLDRLEGAYDRTLGDVVLADGTTMQASYYVGRKHWHGHSKGDVRHCYQLHHNGTALEWPGKRDEGELPWQTTA